jgi:acetyl-CoA synthetase
MATNADTLDEQLAKMLEVERFEPPTHFREQALLNDPAIYERAARDPQAWWVEQAEQLDWFAPWERVLNDSNPPFYKWFEGGTLNASHNCLDRHVAAGLGERVALHWYGENGEQRDITYAELLAEVKRFASALKDQGVRKGDVVGIYLPMIPEVVVAMLACARIGAPHNVVFGGFSAEAVRERMEFSEAKALITVDGAARKGKTAPVKDRVDEVMGDLSTLETIVVVRSKGTPCEMRTGATSTTTRSWPPPILSVQPSRSMPSTRSTSSTRRAQPPSRRESCTPPAVISRALAPPTATCSI